MNFFRNTFRRVLDVFTVELVERTFTHRFIDGRGAKIELRTHLPRFTCKFSEPLAPYFREEYEAWRKQCVAEFEKAAPGTEFSEAELQNEIILFFP